MVGGIIVQILEREDKLYAEVMDSDFSRQWRVFREPTLQIRVGDKLWWQSFGGFISRGTMVDASAGACYPTEHPDNVQA
jgi:hypothetical protein